MFRYDDRLSGIRNTVFIVIALQIVTLFISSVVVSSLAIAVS